MDVDVWDGAMVASCLAWVLSDSNEMYAVVKW